MKRVFICSPYAGAIQFNLRNARRLCLKAMAAGHAPFAPHLIYPTFLADDDPAQRERGILCGLSFMAVCDEVWAYTGAGISPGMALELDHARRLGLPVVEFADMDGEPVAPSPVTQTV